MCTFLCALSRALVIHFGVDDVRELEGAPCSVLSAEYAILRTWIPWISALFLKYEMNMCFQCTG